MNQLIDDLLTYSRVNTQDHSIDNLNIEDQLFIIIKGLDSTIVEHNATIKTNNIPTSILGDGTKLKQLFQNLIANSIKFRKPDVDPEIVISCIENENDWQFELTDNGIGIKEEFYNKIFLLFKKLHGKNEYAGTGIGLALCKKIVEQHGGKIWLTSKENAGTSFFFTISKNVKSHIQNISI